jgi:hypothetical protein
VSEKHDTNAVQDKLEEIRGRLLGNPSGEELHDMQLHLDAIEKVDRVTRMLMNAHDHDHMDDHDHAQ